ncbi:MAG: dihydrolipoamide acetyltransferase family protein [Bacteroidia bacterium]|nr:dihydrolipoamide acetyltransferase family protein [Bacteroidia bacterium]
MRYIFKFPDIGEGLDEGIVAEWYIEKGQTVEMGQPLVKVETDKVVTDIPSPKTGIIAALYGRVGETIHVGSPLVEYDMPGINGADAIAEAAKPAFEAVKEEGAGVVGTLEIADNSAYLPATSEAGFLTARDEVTKPQHRALATPVARAMARELGVKIDLIPGTGPAGRVTKADIEEFVTREDVTRDAKRVTQEDVTRDAKRVTRNATDGASHDPGVSDHASRVTRHDIEIKALSQIRKTIARNMTRSKDNTVPMTVFDEVEVSELIGIRYKYKQQFEEDGIKLSYLPFILKATALALKKHPVLNAELDLDNSRMIYKKYYNLGIAVDTEDGLVVPVIRNVDRLTIKDIAVAVNQISEKARKRGLTMDDMNDGTFTLTNYGSIGGQFAVPVINYPQAGILGIGRLVEKPVIKDGKIVPGTLLPLSLSVDHRMVDGGEVARFLNRVMEYLSDPVSLIIG